MAVYLGRMRARAINSIGLGLNIVGVVLLFFFGYPQPTHLEEGGPVLGLHMRPEERKALAEKNEEIGRTRDAYVFRAHLGLGLIGLGFLFQLVATWLPPVHKAESEQTPHTTGNGAEQAVEDFKVKNLILGAVVVLALWSSALLVVYFLPSWAERGQFGDLFGSVNALFSGLAFAGVIYAIFLQRKELSFQRNELELQREEMRESRKEFAAQAEAQKAMVRVTLGQMRVAVEQASIEAVKVNASQYPQYSDDIRRFAYKIDKIARELETSLTR
jgi:hypothetical protein